MSIWIWVANDIVSPTVDVFSDALLCDSCFVRGIS